VVARDVELGARVLRAGDRVHAVIASANRDPRQFPDPDRFDIGRQPNTHLAFGAGVHYCLGQYLARMEGQEYLRAVATRLPGLRLERADVSYFETPRVRSIVTLPVSWR
jgi:cytochrome P450